MLSDFAAGAQGQIPSPSDTMEFLERGGAFALLAILVLAGGVGMWVAGRALFRLLREFLGATTKQLEAQTKILGDLHATAEKQAEAIAVTSATISPWGSPEWLRDRLDRVDNELREIRDALKRIESKP